MEVDTKTLVKMESLLTYPTSIDHYCGEADCSVESPNCAEMHTQAAMDLLKKVLEPEYVSLQPSRLGNDPERIYTDQWVKENERHPGNNHGFKTLEWILIPDGKHFPDRVTQRDAHVATSVIQWLGTNCGHCFIRRCEQRIEDARKQRSSWGSFVYMNVPAPAGDLATAEILAGPFITGNKKMYRDLVLGIVGALQRAREDVGGSTMASLSQSTLIRGITPPAPYTTNTEAP